jgi:hypothetical protein
MTGRTAAVFRFQTSDTCRDKLFKNGSATAPAVIADFARNT